MEAALDNYLKLTAAATEKFRRQMDEATNLLAEATQVADAGPPDKQHSPGTGPAPGHDVPTRRRPRIFD